MRSMCRIMGLLRVAVVIVQCPLLSCCPVSGKISPITNVRGLIVMAYIILEKPIAENLLALPL
jgi:hypothetical protein